MTHLVTLTVNTEHR